MAHKRDDATLDLFQIPAAPEPAPASMDYNREVAHLVAKVVKEAGCDRFEIAARMSRLTGRDVSKHMIDAWAAESRDHHNIPFYLVPVLEAACETHALSAWLADKRGGRLMVGKEVLAAELGKLERIKDEATQKIKELKRLMGEMES